MTEEEKEDFRKLCRETMGVDADSPYGAFLMEMRARPDGAPYDYDGATRAMEESGMVP